MLGIEKPTSQKQKAKQHHFGGQQNKYGTIIERHTWGQNLLLA